MIQTVSVAQELYAKAALVDHAELTRLQERNAQIDAEELLRDAFGTDVRPVISDWRKQRGIPVSPFAAFRESGYEARVAKERKERRAALGIVSGGSYA
jgi:L-rhamnose isomerase/sugar isomerase